MEAPHLERRLQTVAAQSLIKQNWGGGGVLLHLMIDALIIPQVLKGGVGFSFSPPFHWILFLEETSRTNKISFPSMQHAEDGNIWRPLRRPQPGRMGIPHASRDLNLKRGGG